MVFIRKTDILETGARNLKKRKIIVNAATTNIFAESAKPGKLV